MKALAKIKSLAFLFVGGLALVYVWYSAGISGEAFLVDENGRARPAPGAKVEIFQSDELLKTAEGYRVSDASGIKQFDERLLMLTKAEQEKRSAEKIALALTLVQKSYCEQFSLGRGRYFGLPKQSLNADRNGRFSVRLKPGAYVIFVEGQASNHRAIWLQDVKLRWRDEVRLVEPVYEYAIE